MQIFIVKSKYDEFFRKPYLAIYDNEIAADLHVKTLQKDKPPYIKSLVWYEQEVLQSKYHPSSTE